MLNLFGALVQTAGPCMRILVESFVRQVYLKALVQTYDLFLDQVPFTQFTAHFLSFRQLILACHFRAYTNSYIS